MENKTLINPDYWNYPKWVIPFFMNSDYDQKNSVSYQFLKEKSISATTIMKPLRILLFDILYSDVVKKPNTQSEFASSIGEAIHEKMQNSFIQNYKEIYKLLGVKKSYIDKLNINPKDNLSDPYNVFIEQRFSKEVDGFNINGKMDFIINNKLYDIKTTSVSTYTHNTNYEKYRLQGSIYKYLIPNIIQSNVISIIFVFTSWQKKLSEINPSYPKYQIIVQDIPLLSLEETEIYIKNKLNLLKTYIKEFKEINNQSAFPLCSEEDLWKQDDLYKVFADMGSSRATKNFKNREEAEIFMAELVSKNKKKKPFIEEIPGKYNACNYCKYADVCNQAFDLRSNFKLV